MKKLSILLIFGMLLLSLAACTHEVHESAVDNKSSKNKKAVQIHNESSKLMQESTQKSQVKKNEKKKEDGSNDQGDVKKVTHKNKKDSVTKGKQSNNSTNESASKPANTPQTNNSEVESKNASSSATSENLKQEESNKKEIEGQSVNATPQQKTVSKSSNESPQQATAPSQPVIAETKLAKQTNQILTVVASGIHAHITLWTKNGDIWGKALETNGFVGKYGIGHVHEGSMKTPYGAYSLGFAFGTSNPGTKLPFRLITPTSWWVEDSNDSKYNTWQEGDHFNKPSEHLADYPVQYEYAVVINYNTARTPWAGSGFFIHVSNGSYTAGCVSLPESQMVQLLRILEPNAYILNVTSESMIKGF
ncbi:L,D-transpeptidase family protein [Sporolactobacillus laevolacticus]|uniref:L,D-transpeptidase family protein n=1 Tax=Sporolactobacillus laevolacticus TaxID=33018 RepID=UPI0025B54FF4|nr:S-layer protein [Sporolactobacillus laevolacticus]MDN3955814.1 S-layer protein [Sporolactobacillus laevolacticus]